MNKYIQLIRVKHWIKNFLIFTPLVFSGLFNLPNLILTLGGGLSFCLMSSFVYIINDLKDIEKDKLHPRKKKRPLASGAINKNQALIIASILLIIAIMINSLINKSFFNLSLAFLISYLVINIIYSCGLKNIAILDIFLLASGFVLRVYYGAALINVEVSNWLFLTILNASLFLGLNKRKKEYAKNKKTRKVLAEYNEAFLDKFSYLTLTLTIVFYSLWATIQKAKFMYLSIPIIMIIFMRYCLILEKSDDGDPTSILYEDKPLIVLCLFYIITMVLIIL